MNKSPISFFWQPGTSGLESLLNGITCFSPHLLQRRLSWRSSDSEFADFLDFIGIHGAATDLSGGEWMDIFSRHLSHMPNQHFLFLLWHSVARRQEGDHPPPMSSWLPPNLEKQFSEWARCIEQDESLTATLRQTARKSQLGIHMTYRSIQLLSAVEYPAFPTLLAKVSAEDSTQ